MYVFLVRHRPSTSMAPLSNPLSTILEERGTHVIPRLAFIPYMARTWHLLAPSLGYFRNFLAHLDDSFVFRSLSFAFLPLGRPSLNVAITQSVSDL